MSTGARDGAETQVARTAWARNLAAPVRDFIATETGSAVVLVGAAAVALIWANGPWRHSYGDVWGTRLAVQLGGSGVSLTLREWVNEGLMTFFFLVVGLEAKRELDVGDLRERRRVAIPMLAAIGGIVGAGRDLPAVQRRQAPERTAGARRCPPTPRSRSAHWRC